MNRRVALRAAVLAAIVVGVIAGLTVYFSTQTTPPCFTSGVPKWRPPTDAQLHRFELVVPDRWICFFDMDSGNALVGYLKLPGVDGITSVASSGNALVVRYHGRGARVDLDSGRIAYGVPPPPPPSDTITVTDPATRATYVTRKGFLGVVEIRGTTRTKLTFPGFTWNPHFGPDPPDHGQGLSPDRSELWVLDAPNNIVHVFDLSGTPRIVANVRLTKDLIGDENPCASNRCARIGSLQFSADGRFVYVGDSGDVFDAQKREQLTNLEALHQSRLTLEVDWVDGKPAFPSR